MHVLVKHRIHHLIRIPQFEKENNTRAVELLTNISPVAWEHIQLTGYYVFEGKEDTLNLENMLESINPWEHDKESNLISAA